MTDGSWLDDCNGRLGGLLQETNIDVFLADGFWPANVTIRKGGAVKEEMTGSDAGDVTVNIHPYLTSDQLHPEAFKFYMPVTRRKKSIGQAPRLKASAACCPECFFQILQSTSSSFNMVIDNPQKEPELPCGAPGSDGSVEAFLKDE
jgi:hypothetical protein